MRDGIAVGTGGRGKYPTSIDIVHSEVNGGISRDVKTAAAMTYKAFAGSNTFDTGKHCAVEASGSHLALQLAVTVFHVEIKVVGGHGYTSV